MARQIPYVQAVRGVNPFEALQAGYGTYQGIRQQQTRESEDQAKMQERFDKEKAILSASIEGKPLDVQKQEVGRRIAMLTDQGRDATDTQRLYDLLDSGDENKVKQATMAISQAAQKGTLQGHIKAPQQQKIDPYSGLPVGSPEHQAFARQRIAKSGTRINVNTGAKSQTEWDKGFAKMGVERYQKVNEAGNLANDIIDQVSTVEAIQTPQGALEPAKLKAGALYEAFGGDPKTFSDSIAAGQSYQALTLDMMLDKTKKLKGAISEKEMDVIRKTVPQLGNTPEANQFLIDTAKASAYKARAKAEFYDTYRDKHINNPKKLANVGNEWRKSRWNDPLITRHKVNGLPVFKHQYEEQILQEYPDATQEEISHNWKTFVKSGGKVSGSGTMPQPKQPVQPTTNIPGYLQRGFQNQLNPNQQQTNQSRLLGGYQNG
jgi:hypothetical protein